MSDKIRIAGPFLTPAQNEHLERECKRTGATKSEQLRKLVQKDLEANNRPSGLGE